MAGHAVPAATGILGESYRTAVAYEARSMTKAEIVDALKASFEHLEMAVGATSATQLSESVRVFGALAAHLDPLARAPWPVHRLRTLQRCGSALESLSRGDQKQAAGPGCRRPRLPPLLPRRSRCTSPG